MNALVDPYTGAASQPAYPWRGRITVAPAPQQPGSPDKTAAAATQLDAFVGTAQVSDFAIVGDSVVYSGPAERSYRRFILHYAHLAAAAGGVDALLIGSEMRGLTQVRDSASHYPFVDALADLAAEVKAVLGPAAKVTYAADWSEYFGHQPADGSGDAHFHLDPLWSSPDIDAVGIDVYWPLADWRDGFSHADRAAGALSTYDLAYLRPNIAGGEGYDWYYASDTDRDGQVRTPITDGAYAKPWMFRFKDIKSWWLEEHFDRLGGVQSPTPTGWVPQSKPIWFTELGCPAVDKGANQPNVFVDPKSSESDLPHYSKACATISRSAATSRPSSPASIPATPTTSPAAIPHRPSTRAAWSTSTTFTSTPGMRALIQLFPATSKHGATPRIGVWAIGSLAATPMRRSRPPCRPS